MAEPSEEEIGKVFEFTNIDRHKALNRELIIRALKVCHIGFTSPPLHFCLPELTSPFTLQQKNGDTLAVVAEFYDNEEKVESILVSLLLLQPPPYCSLASSFVKTILRGTRCRSMATAMARTTTLACPRSTSRQPMTPSSTVSTPRPCTLPPRPARRRETNRPWVG